MWPSPSFMQSKDIDTNCNVCLGKEGTEGTVYTYTLDINDMNSVGRATKKKDAKNFAFRYSIDHDKPFLYKLHFV